MSNRNRMKTFSSYILFDMLILEHRGGVGDVHLLFYCYADSHAMRRGEVMFGRALDESDFLSWGGQNTLCYNDFLLLVFTVLIRL